MSIDKIVLEDNSKVKLMNDEYPKQLEDMSPSILSDMKLWHGQLPRSPNCGVWGNSCALDHYTERITTETRFNID